MKKQIGSIIIISAAVILFLSACKKDYIKGGTTENVNAYAQMTTYDVLKSNPAYDTLVMLIDTAGLQDKINEQGITFFAPSDFSIFIYLNLRTLDAQLVDVNAKFALDSLCYDLKNNVNGTRDSLLMYLIQQPLTYNMLTNTGTKYPTELPGDSAIVSYEFTKDPNLGYSTSVSSVPQVVYFTQLWYPFDVSEADPAGSITAEIGVHTLCKTSGIITKTGIMNALENSHVLFFHNTKQ